MKVLCIGGQLREGGNTEHLFDAVRDELRKTEVSVDSVALSDRKIADCNDCGGCAHSYECTVEDDMTPLYRKVLEADAIVLSSPVYMWNITGKLKCFVDRLFCITSKLEGKKIGLVLTAGGDAFDGADLCVSTVRRLADYTGMHMIETLFRRAHDASGYKAWDKTALEQDVAEFCGELTSED